MKQWPCPLPAMNATYFRLFSTIPGICPQNYKECKEAKKCNLASREEAVQRTRPRNSPGIRCMGGLQSWTETSKTTVNMLKEPVQMVANRYKLMGISAEMETIKKRQIGKKWKIPVTKSSSTHTLHMKSSQSPIYIPNPPFVSHTQASIFPALHNPRPDSRQIKTTPQPRAHQYDSKQPLLCFSPSLSYLSHGNPNKGSGPGFPCPPSQLLTKPSVSPGTPWCAFLPKR